MGCYTSLAHGHAQGTRFVQDLRLCVLLKYHDNYIVSGQLYRDTYRIVAYPYRPSPNGYGISSPQVNLLLVALRYQFQFQTSLEFHDFKWCHHEYRLKLFVCQILID